METTALISKARGGDAEAFAKLVEPYRRELHMHCYRMLGSFQDAEDAFQETLLAAWQHLSAFEGRSSLRTWLYRIATNRCLNALRDTTRRYAVEWNVPRVERPEPTRSGQVRLEPYPDALLSGVLDHAPGPDARYEQTEGIALGFVTVLRQLTPRQRAVLVLRDVLGHPAKEVAAILEITQESVTSALKRARATLRRAPAPAVPPPAPGSPVERALVTRLVRAYEAGDLPGLIALLTDDLVITVPPMALE